VLAITQRKFGGPEVLEIQNVDRPTGLPTEVIVRVNAVGLNSIDADVRSGVSPVLRPAAIHARVGYLRRG
jgi:NADPH:quinone reductase-like Zn-dependent oxidoreductase